MKKYISILSFISLFISCSPESSTTETDKPEEKTFQVDLNSYTFQPEVDEMIPMSLDSELPLYEVSQIWEGGKRSLSAGNPGESLPEDLELYFRFAGPGTKDIHLEFTSVNGITVSKNIVFQVSRGNAVKITKVVVNSFHDMDKTWDPEYSEEDEDRLADVAFALEKIQHYNFTTNALSVGGWHLSDIRENQKDLSWDLSEEELYINPENQLRFGLADVDDGNISENLLLDHSTRHIYFREYMETRPESISLLDESVNLDVTIYLEWPSQ